MKALNAAMQFASGQGVLYSQEVAGRLGIASTDLECLGLLRDDPVTAGELARATGLTSGAITGVIDRLEKAGLAKRETDPNDRRKVLVRATPAAAKRVVPLFEPMMRHSTAALAGYSDDELDLLLGFFRKAHAGAVAATDELRASPKRIRAR